MRADEVDIHDRVRHPDTGQIVTVTRVAVGLAKCNIYYRVNGFQGRLTVAPHTEVEEIL